MEAQNKVLLYQTETGKPDIEVVLEGETVWLTLMQMTELFQSSKQNVAVHISNIFQDNELEKNRTVKEYLTVQNEGGRSVKRTVLHYNLDVIISVGYRVKSIQGIRFRIWATERIKEYLVKGFVMDDARLAGTKKNYFDELQDRVRAIRTSERNFWQKVTDIFATSIDYNPSDKYSKLFFASVQNMFHYAIHGHTAAELIWQRVDAEKVNLGLATWKGELPTKEDVKIAKNFLNEMELRRLNLLVEQYLSFAELQSIEKRPMKMMDWHHKLRGFFILNDKPILVDVVGKIGREKGQKKAIEEYSKYEKKRQDKMNQDRLDKTDSAEIVP